MASFPQIANAQQRPVAIEMETTILGALLVEPTAFYEACDLINVVDFAMDSHRRIYGAILGLSEDNSPVDIITVSEELRKRGELSSIGGIAYLAKLSEGLPRKLSIKKYVKEVRNKSRLRQLMSLAERMYAESGENDAEAEAVFSQWQLDLFELAGDSAGNASEDIRTIIPRVLQKIGEQRSSSVENDALGYTTGIQDLDKWTKGLFPNEYTIILGETNGAKTPWATQISVENGFKGIRSHWFSQEMTREQLTQRILVYASQSARAKDVRDPRFLNITDFTDLGRTGDRLMNLPIGIDDSRQLPLDKLIARAKVAIHRDSAKLIVVDYLQLVRSSSGVRQTDVERIEATTLALRDLAAESKDHGVHVVALSQYSRPSDSKGASRNSRAKGSSSLEQSCHNMFHIIREKDEETGAFTPNGEIEIGKNREGTLGRVPFYFDGDHLKFMGVR